MNIKNNKNCKITINNEEIVVSQKEKTADEMFEELGYEVSNSEFVEELNTTTNTIVDNGYIKIIFYNNKTMSIDANDILNMQELQAINKKVLELGWLKKEN